MQNLVYEWILMDDFSQIDFPAFDPKLAKI